MRVGVETRRRLVAVTAIRRRPPRLDGVVSLSAESIRAFVKEYGSYKHELLRDANDVQGQEKRRPAMRV